MKKGEIIIVSGLPRSGTSMVMQMLKAGGASLLIDNVRRADKDNPQGYYELEKVKEIKKNQAWLKGAQGKAVKIISYFLKYLPKDYCYKVIFIDRNLREILASQKQMLLRKNKSINDKDIANSFLKHIKEVKVWLKKQSNIKFISVNYNQVLDDPKKEVKKLNKFLNLNLNSEVMIKAIDPQLYRQKFSKDH